MEDVTDSGDVTDLSTASTKIEDENRLKISEEFDLKQVIINPTKVNVLVSGEFFTNKLDHCNLKTFFSY